MKYLVCWLFLSLVFATGAEAQIRFTNRNDLLRDKDLHSAVPVGVADMNGDGLDDIVALHTGNELFIQYQTADPERPFVRYLVSQEVDSGEQNDICIADFNNDGANDILTVGSYDRIKVYYNVPYTYTFNLVHITVMPFFSQGASTGDFNQDGWVDVVLLNDNGTNFALINDGTGNLVEQPYFNFNTVPPSDNSGNYGSLYTDFDMDGDLDFYIAKCRQGVGNGNDPRRINVLFENDGTGQFTENAKKYGLAIGHQTWTADFGDMDNDGDLDCFMTQHNVICQLYENIDNDTFINITPTTGLNIGGVPLQGMFVDFDNDGWQDLLVSGDRLDLYRNNGDKTFTREDIFGSIIFGTYGVGDLNADGFTDIYASRVIPFNNPDLLREDLLYINDGNDNHFLSLEVNQTSVNPSAIGTMAMLYGPWGVQIREVRAGEQYGVSNTHKMIFGLGEETKYDSLIIRWPDNTRQRFDTLEVDAHWVLQKDICATQSIQVFDLFEVICNDETVELNAGDFTMGTQLWSTGEIGETIEVSEAGLYFVELMGDDGCIIRTTPIEIVKDPDTIKPVIIYVGKSQLCDGEYATLMASDGLGYTWSTGETTSSIEAAFTGPYYVEVQGYCLAQFSDTIVLDFLVPDLPLVQPDSFKLGESAELFAGGDNITWFADPQGTVELGTGNTLVLDDLTETTIVYAQNMEAILGTAHVVGPVSQQGNTKYNASFVNGGLLFSVLDPIMLQQVTMYTDSFGQRTIEIWDGAGFFFQKNVDLTMDTTVVDLNVLLPVGSYTISTNTDTNNIEFGVNSPYLWRSSEGVLYPYRIDNVVSINNSTFGEDFYYYFYDWKVETLPRYCLSPLVPDTAYLDLGVAVGDVSEAKYSIQLNPNPVKDILFVTWESPAPAAMELHTMDGKRILRKENDGTWAEGYSLNVSSVQSGMYVLRVFSDGMPVAVRLIKL